MDIERIEGRKATTTFSPLLLRRSEVVASPTTEADDVDPSLVAAERYDPQSKAFSYVPAHSLQEHFNAPRKATKLIPVYDKLPNAAFGPLDVERLDPLYDTPRPREKCLQPLHIETPPHHYEGGHGSLLTTTSKDWLERQMEKLKTRRIDNDPDLKLRKEQERMLLDELKHVNDERHSRRSEADYCVEGYGSKSVEPQFSREDIYSKIATDRIRRTPPPLPARSLSAGNGECCFFGVQPSPKSILKKPKDFDVPTTSTEDYRKLRATTPAFPSSEPYQPLLYYQGSSSRSQMTTPTPMRDIYFRRPSLQYLEYGSSSNNMENLINQHPVFVKDTSKYWYKPKISRDEAISMLRDKTPGTFVIRDSNSFPGAFGLALKVAVPPPGVQTRSNDGTELVRHFLIEPTAKGVKLKGCNNEPVFGSLAALVYQHSITPLALPVKLILPDRDPALEGGGSTSSASTLLDFQAQNKAQALLEQGAACNVTYLFSCDVESLTGPEAVRRTVDRALFLSQRNDLQVTNVHFKVASAGITLTDNTRRLFFRRHYPVQAVTFCGLDPDERRWNPVQLTQSHQPAQQSAARIFGFVAKKCPANVGQNLANGQENSCHVFAEFEPEQPASAIVNFVTKVMMASFRSQNLPRTIR